MFNSRQLLGQSGERLAVQYLIEQGYSILSTNYHCRAGELDIVAKDGEYLVIVEVKTRRSLQFGNPVEAIDQHKRYQISRASEHFLVENEIDDYDIRFDVIGIYCPEGENPTIEHIKNAFDFSA